MMLLLETLSHPRLCDLYGTVTCVSLVKMTLKRLFRIPSPGVTVSRTDARAFSLSRDVPCQTSSRTDAGFFAARPPARCGLCCLGVALLKNGVPDQHWLRLSQADLPPEESWLCCGNEEGSGCPVSGHSVRILRQLVTAPIPDRNRLSPDRPGSCLSHIAFLKPACLFLGFFFK